MPRFVAAATFAIALLAAPLTARAADATVMLDVHHAGCVLCGPIVQSTLTHVQGVSAVRVSQADGNADVIATVTYDTARISPAALIRATTDHGYPAAIAKPGAGG